MILLGRARRYAPFSPAPDQEQNLQKGFPSFMCQAECNRTSAFHPMRTLRGSRNAPAAYTQTPTCPCLGASVNPRRTSEQLEPDPCSECFERASPPQRALSQPPRAPKLGILPMVLGALLAALSIRISDLERILGVSG